MDAMGHWNAAREAENAGDTVRAISEMSYCFALAEEGSGLELAAWDAWRRLKAGGRI